MNLPEKPTCSNCAFGVKFNKRADEPSGQGCKLPGWEGYTRDEAPSCGGKYHTKKEETK